MQSKTTKTYHFTPTSIARIEKPGVGVDTEKSEPSHTAGESVKWSNCLENSLAGFPKVKHKVTM